MEENERDASSPDPEHAEPVRIPINGVLDLHTFRPAEVRRLVQDYLRECRDAGILQVRIIHGKGTGTLRQAVREALRGHEYVSKFEEGGSTEGGEGVTVALMKSG